MINLLTSEINTFERNIIAYSIAIVSPLSFICVSIILFITNGWTFIFGLGYFLLSLLVHKFLLNASVKSRVLRTSFIDRRLKSV